MTVLGPIFRLDQHPLTRVRHWDPTPPLPTWSYMLELGSRSPMLLVLSPRCGDHVPGSPHCLSQVLHIIIKLWSPHTTSAWSNVQGSSSGSPAPSLPCPLCGDQTLRALHYLCQVLHMGIRLWGLCISSVQTHTVGSGSACRATGQWGALRARGHGGWEPRLAGGPGSEHPWTRPLIYSPARYWRGIEGSIIKIKMN